MAVKKKLNPLVAWAFTKESETSSEGVVENPQGTASGSSSSTATQTLSAPISTMSGIAVLDQKIVDALTTKVNEKNLPGYDYLEFINSYNAMADVIPDEVTRLKAAFKSAATMGVTKERLIETVGFYIKVLDEESASFNAQFEERTVENDKKNIQMKGIDDKITQNLTKIQSLNEEITTLNAQKVTINTQMTEEKNKIQSVKEKFLVSCNFIKNTFNSHKEKITQYL